MATIYSGADGIGRPYPRGGFDIPLENANAPEALSARQRALDRAALRNPPAPLTPPPSAAPGMTTVYDSGGNVALRSNQAPAGPNSGPQRPPSILRAMKDAALHPVDTIKKAGGALRRAGGALAPAEGRLRSVARATGSGVATGTKAVGPALAGVGAAVAANSLRQDEVDGRPAFVPPTNQNTPGQIPVDPRQTGPAPAAGRMLDQTELGRNIGNAALALPGGRAVMGVPGLLRTGAGLRGANAVAAAAPAAAVAGQVGKGFAAGDAVSPGTAPATEAPVDPAQASYSNEGRNYPDPNSANRLRGHADQSEYLAGGGRGEFDPTNGFGGGPNRRLPQDLSMLNSGQVYKTIDPATGRTVYSGVNVKENANIVDGRGVKTGQLTNHPNGNNFVQNLDENGRPIAPVGGMTPGLDARLSDAIRAAAARGDWDAVARAGGLPPNHPLSLRAAQSTEPTPGFNGGFSGATLSSALRERVNAEGSLARPRAPSDMTRAGRERAFMQERELAARREEANALRAERQAALEQQARLADMSNATSRENNERTVGATLRGQDNQLRAAMAPIEYQRQLRAEQGQLLRAAGGDTAVASELARRMGRPDLTKVFDEQTALRQTEAAKTQDLEKGARDRSRAKFDGLMTYMINEGTPAEKAQAAKPLEDKAYNTLIQAVPGWEQLSSQQQSAAMQRAVALVGLIEKTQVADTDIFAHTLMGKGSISDSPGLRSGEFFRGGKLNTPYGTLAGLVSLRYDKGDANFELPGGRGSIRIARPTEEERKVLDMLSKGQEPFAEFERVR